MRRAALVLTAVAMLMFVVGAAPALAQEPQQPPPQSQAQPPAPAPLQGELVQVDADAKTLSVKTADAEVVFQYNDKTEVTGAKEGVAGLGTIKGTQVTVHFTEDAEAKTRTATRIIVQPAKQ